jgi:hypothetical protein
MTTTPRTSTRTRTALVAGLLLTAGLGATACGDGGGTAEAGTTSTTAVEPAVVEVDAVDFAFDGLPERVAAGTRLTLTNGAATELHELVAFRLPDDEERPVAELVRLPPDELMGILGPGPATVLLAAPGGDVIPAVGDGTLDEPGRYAVLCMIPTGADPEAYLEAAAAGQGPPQVEGGAPHIAHGMWAELEVE